MRFLNSILLLATVIAAVLVPILIGHGWAAGATGPVLLGLGMLAAAGALTFASSRAGRNRSG